MKEDGGAELLRLVHERLDRSAVPPAAGTRVPDLRADTAEERERLTADALREAAEEARGVWTLLDHPVLSLDVAGAPAFLEPDAVVVHPDGTWTVVEIKSFPMLDGSADPAKVGAAARQAAVYVLALERVAAGLAEPPPVGHRVLLVCPKDFSNLPTASAVDIRKQRAVTARQLARLTRVQEIADALPEDVCFDPARPAEELERAVAAVPASYAPECLSTCELAFHCRARARAGGAVTSLGRSVRAELGGLATVPEVLAAARGEAGDPSDPAVAALRRAARLRARALAAAGAVRAPDAAGPAEPTGSPVLTGTADAAGPASPAGTPDAPTPAAAGPADAPSPATAQGAADVPAAASASAGVPGQAGQAAEGVRA